MATLFDSGIRPAIDEYLRQKSLEVRSYGSYWSASSAGYCMRRLMFERLGVPHSTPEDERKTRVFEAGDIFHGWVQGITKSAGLSLAQELELQDEDLMVRGHCDDIIGINDKLILYDYKTVHSRSFHWSKKSGGAISHYHRMQIGTYMYMLRRLPEYVELDEARVMKISKDDLCMDEQQVLWTPELEAEILDFWSRLNGFWDERKLPGCTCHVHEGGFLAREGFNPFYYEGEPCSLEWYKLSKKGNKQ